MPSRRCARGALEAAPAAVPVPRVAQRLPHEQAADDAHARADAGARVVGALLLLLLGRRGVGIAGRRGAVSVARRRRAGGEARRRRAGLVVALMLRLVLRLVLLIGIAERARSSRRPSRQRRRRERERAGRAAAAATGARQRPYSAGRALGRVPSDSQADSNSTQLAPAASDELARRNAAKLSWQAASARRRAAPREQGAYAIGEALHDGSHALLGAEFYWV